ncbi:Bestrophin, RFP-TM, chloride channel-domain-containing protein [Gautieria morchelliformis]|nr:Bestrophin, RFP-TM, chloride channel-domain-containing protein [Gautieria morchelliformis]
MHPPNIRSLVGNQGLLPASNKSGKISLAHLPMREPSASTIGFGTVVWRIWPAVLLHTVFATIIVVVSRKTNVDLGIPNVLLTLLGVVIGFVISLRVSSGYVYWWGRCAWSDIIKTSRTMSRLAWIHVPPRITKPNGNAPIPREEIGQSMREKRIALELIEAFAVAVKHYVRGELGIYYEDLYPVVRPFHEHHPHTHAEGTPPPVNPPGGNRRTPKRQHSIESYSQLPSGQLRTSASFSRTTNSRQSSLPSVSRQSTLLQPEDPIITPINSYGATSKGLAFSASRTSLVSSNSSLDEEREPLLPSAIIGPQTGASADLIPFRTVIGNFASAINPLNWWRAWRANWREGFEGNDQAGGVGIQWGHPDLEHGSSPSAEAHPDGPNHHHHKHRRAARQTHTEAGKHRPRVAGDGENLPLEIVRCMSEWLSILEARGTVGGNALGGLYGCVAAYEDILCTLERILTTPLPYVYSVHISTVWLYLLFLPFQLADDFNWYTIPGTAVAAFFYLGFIAAGDEIEQPFGYDENDLDLDLFCRDVVQVDLHTLMITPFPNAPTGSHHGDIEINEASTVVDVSLGRHHV